LFRVCGTGAALPFLESKWTRIRRRSIAVCDVDWCEQHPTHVCVTPKLNLTF
jgi:hypothetical protein